MINNSMERFKRNLSAKFIIVSFSPTGGGHTGRLLNIVSMALESKAISAGSIVLFHIPCLWEGAPRSPLIAALAKKLLTHQVDVWLAESDKSVYGYLNKETGGSDDASILQHISRFPLRNAPEHASKQTPSKTLIADVAGCVLFRTDTDCNNLPVISAKDLMSSVHAGIGRVNIEGRCYILTDMDPYLQKAAANQGVPGKRRLDQQNHAILLDLSDVQLNLLPQYALLSKVLGGFGEQVSHIDLGGRNTLTSLTQITTSLAIDSGTSKFVARTKVADLLLSHAVSAHEMKGKLASESRPFAGVIAGSAVQQGKNARNIIYVYAHKKTNLIASCVCENILSNEASFKDMIFLFCGPGAAGTYNAMHLAYIADADGITTAGAGTVGEYVYLRKEAQCSSRLLILPIEGHNEQEKNADVISTDKTVKSFIMRTAQRESLSESLQRFVTGNPRNNEAPCTMSEFITAVSNPETYVKQAHDILFGGINSGTFNSIEQLEMLMNKSPLLKATRKYMKLVFQSVDMASKNPTGAIKIALQQGQVKTFSNVNDLNNTLQNPSSLARVIGLHHENDVSSLPLLKEVKAYFLALVSNHSSSENTLRGEKLKEEFGEFMITGF